MKIKNQKSVKSSKKGKFCINIDNRTKQTGKNATKLSMTAGEL
jgi:hypothetical protein